QRSQCVSGMHLRLTCLLRKPATSLDRTAEGRGPYVIAKPEALPVPSRALPLSALWLNQTQVSPTPAVCLEDLNAVPDQPLQPGEWRASARAWIYNAALARLCRQQRTEE